MTVNVESKLEEFLKEDIGAGDISSSLLPEKYVRAKIISKQDAVIAGVKFAETIFNIHKCDVQILKNDGEKIKAGGCLLIINGIAPTILSCERTILNLLSRMSGIATYTNKLVQVTKRINPKISVCATRKTAPGLRYFDKIAVELGGGIRHRMDLNEFVILKDNHIAVYGSIENLIKQAKSKYKIIETEVDSLSDALLAAKAGSDVIMLDNFSTEVINSTIHELTKLGIRKKIKIEISGGINIKNISKYAKTTADWISIGAITNSVSGIDFSLDVIS
ncbi:MAG: carboxylating nicotinate-nucleotide diphosphorylase [Nitrosopumilaceae archaeon]|nr:carboxylating nicotinate-nucleotide diphosphorylase [Nitrosopumilaceae archaeon]